MVGFGGGIGATYNWVANRPSIVANDAKYNRSNPASPVEASAITGIRSVTQEPGSNQVNIKYDTVSTQEAQGFAERPAHPAVAAVRGAPTTTTRECGMDSVDVLTQAPANRMCAKRCFMSLQNEYRRRVCAEGSGWTERFRATG